MYKDIERSFVYRYDLDSINQWYQTQRNLPFMRSKGDREAVASANLAFNDAKRRWERLKAHNLKLSFSVRTHLLLWPHCPGSPVLGASRLYLLNMLQIREDSPSPLEDSRELRVAAKVSPSDSRTATDSENTVAMIPPLSQDPTELHKNTLTCYLQKRLKCSPLV